MGSLRRLRWVSMGPSLDHSHKSLWVLIHRGRFRSSLGRFCWGFESSMNGVIIVFTQRSMDLCPRWFFWKQLIWLRFRRTQGWPMISLGGWQKIKRVALNIESLGQWSSARRYIIQGISAVSCISAMGSGWGTLSNNFSICKHTCRHRSGMICACGSGLIDPPVQPGRIAFFHGVRKSSNHASQPNAIEY